MDSSSDNCNPEHGLVKVYNTQVRFGAWGVDAGLLNYVINQVWIYIP
jgi:hypothetical protein